MIHLTEAAVLGLASARGVQLIVHDSILDRWRERLELWHARKHDSAVRTFFRTLLACIYCVGFHTSWLAVAAWYTTAGTWDSFDPLTFGLDSFAVAAVAMLINRFDDHLGS